MAVPGIQEAPHGPVESDSTTVLHNGVLTAIDPATGKTIGTLPITPEDRIPEIVSRAREAQRKWAALPFVERARGLTELRAVGVRRADEIAETVSLGMGKPLVAAPNPGWARTSSAAALPFGGNKQSGINRYHGMVGLQLFSNIKAMVISDGKQDTESYWFPYSDALLKAVEGSLR